MIKNLALAKHSIMAKNFFKFFNTDDAIWVDILHLKYVVFNFWREPMPSNCS